MLNDLRYAVRMLLKSPGFTVVAILTLFLGIGANTGIFSLINALLLRELPVPEPHRLVALSTLSPKDQPAGLSYLMFDEIRHQQTVFSSLFAWSGEVLYNLEANGGLWLSPVSFVTGDYYRTLGLVPFMGRTIQPEDEGLQGGLPNNVAVISFGCWQRRYGADPAVIGKVIRVEGKSYTIVGVTPQDFIGLRVGTSEDVTVPLTNLLPIERLRRGRSLSFDIVGRLKDGISLQQASAQLEVLWPGIQKATISPDWSPAEQKEFLSYRLQVLSAATGAGWASYLRQFYLRPLWILMGLVGVVLLIACVNLASLFLARGAVRQRDMAVRLALGAGAGRLMRQMLTESLLLSVAGALAGLLLAGWARRLLVNFMSEGWLVPLALDLSSDLHVLGFTSVAAVLTGILFGLAPAWRASRADPGRLLQQHAQRLGSGMGRVGRLLVSVQVALSLVSLIASGLLVRSLRNLRSVDAGFPTQRLLIMLLNQKPGGYKNFNRTVYYHALVNELSASPGVRSVALCGGIVGLPRDYYMERVSPKSADGSPSGSIDAAYNAVSPGFFETLGIPLLQGRDFSWRDDPQAPRVAIVSQNLARQLFPSSDAIGQHIRLGTSPENQDLVIIGVASNISFSPRRNTTTSAVYLAYLQDKYNQPFVHVRTRGEPLAMAASLQRRIEAVGREYPLHTTTFSRELDHVLLPERLITILSGFFGLLALVLVSIGLYGLLSYAVTHRTAEIGIRMALGAQGGNVLWLVLAQTLRLVLIGVAIGVPLAIASARFISSQLFGLKPTDPPTVTVATLLLVAVAAFASYLPARRASRVDPMVALRYE
jgi:predicted permease